MSKHTPGPWKVVPSLNEIVNADHGLLRYDIRADYTLIGALYENEADARLIAAAPDLLEVAQAIVDALTADPSLHGLLLSGISLRAQTAIAKATGGSND